VSSRTWRICHNGIIPFQDTLNWARPWLPQRCLEASNLHSCPTCAGSDRCRVAQEPGSDHPRSHQGAGAAGLLQIATRQRTFLIDPFAVGDLQPLIEVLSGAMPLKVIHNARFERRVLATIGIPLNGAFDTLEASR
jgi:hypothetical protein